MSQNTTIMSVQILTYVETLYVLLFIVKMAYKSHTIRFKQKSERIFMFVPCINSIKTLFYYSKLMSTIIKS